MNPFIFRMAWRETRGAWRHFLYFFACIAIGVGASAASRRPLGIAIVGGLIVSQFITLYVTPVIYLYMELFQEKVLNRIPFFAQHFEAQPALAGVALVPIDPAATDTELEPTDLLERLGVEEVRHRIAADNAAEGGHAVDRP